MRVLFLGTIGWVLAALAPCDTVAAAAGRISAADPSGVDEAAPAQRAAVTLDGEVLFQVLGFATYPAAERAQTIRQRIQAIAADRSIPIDSLHVVEMEGRTRIMARDRLVVGF